MISPPNCFVCLAANFEEIFSCKKLGIFSALRSVPFTEQSRFDAILFRCKACGFVQQNPTPRLKKFLASFYKKAESFTTAPPAKNAVNNKTSFNIEFLRKHLSSPLKSVLEIGCYDGYFLDSIRRSFRVRTAVGIEVLKLKQSLPHLRIVHDFYPTRKVSGESFDLIVMMSVLEHVFSPRNFMVAIKKNLSEHGRILISIPNEELAFRHGMLSFHHQHISYFTPQTIRRFLASAGFVIDAIHTDDLSRILLLCSRGEDPRASWAIDRSAVGYTRRWKQIVRKITTLMQSRYSLGLYGACNFTNIILQIVRERPPTLTIFDGDNRKWGAYMSGMRTPVRPWSTIDSSGLQRLIVMPLAFTPVIADFLHLKGIRTPIRKLFNIRPRNLNTR